jgi:UDP-N-acetylmuramyl-tripeptide synthetase
MTCRVSGITHDSRHVQQGDLFVCLQGANFNGHRFAEQAVAQGAVAVVESIGGLEAAGVTLPQNVTVLTVPDTRKALPYLACTLYGNPAHRMIMVGVTGTNGKTTTTLMIAAILRAHGLRVGTIGTLGSELDGKPIPSDHTTPEADQLQAVLAQMEEEGAQAVVMEVSSHALALHRADGIPFNAAVFTNLTQDHLDYHGTMEAYFTAKARLFTDFPVQFPRPDGKAFVGAINVNQWEGRDLVTIARGDIITTSTTSTPAVLKGEEIELKPDSVQFVAVYDSGVDRYRLPIRLPLGGAFQADNALGAISATLRLGIPRETIQRGLEAMNRVPGRFEAVPTGTLGFQVVVDYAHTPDGLANLLKSAQNLHPKRILVVFGCGGDRDRTKRPLMGGLAGRMADVAIVTSDNPRTEDPQAILQEILTGMDKEKDKSLKATVLVEADRRTAIGLAIEQAEEGDLVLIAGKGHEDYQIVGKEVLPFDDRKVASEWLAKRTKGGE